MPRGGGGVSEGIAGEKDTLPPRMTKEAIDPNNPKTKVPLKKMLHHYYRVRGWDKNGIPTPSLLRRLDMRKFMSK